MLFLESIIEDGNSYQIRNFPLANFSKRLKKYYKSNKLSTLFEAVGFSRYNRFNKNSKTIKIHKFFIPELIYLLRKFNYPKKLIDTIIDNTWVKKINDERLLSRVDLKEIKQQMTLSLRDFQQDFIMEYDIKRQKYQLNGYLLSFDQGLGKTITALALMVSLKKKTVIIIAPKSTLQTVWQYHLDTFFKTMQSTVIINKDPIDPKARFIILNYEAMDKIDSLIPTLSKHKDDIGIIVDESHNFLRQQSLRTITLIKLRQALDCKDILMMSGTPIKALGIEVMPLLMILDPYFDEQAARLYKTAFGVNTDIAADVLRSRMEIMMHRKVKEQVLTLPKKTEQTIKVTLLNGMDYTVSSVQKAVVIFAEKRFTFHRHNMDQYLSDFYEAIGWVSQYPIGNTKEFEQYLEDVLYLRGRPANMRLEYDRLVVSRTNAYETNAIIPLLNNDMKVKFKSSKSAVKYLHLKIKGEVIGQLLTGLRIKMTTEMIKGCQLEKLVDLGIKKTVIFTSYTDVLEQSGDYLRTFGYKPVLVYGKTANDTKAIVDRFKTDPDVNPIIASLLSMSTGVTLTEADTMIFLNKPWRHVDYAQASDRIHRIGQDTEVTIYSLVLDTGDEENLSTRMEFINEWSKEQFESIVGGSKEPISALNLRWGNI